MFTGIITHQGTFAGFRRGRQEMLVEAPGLADKVKPGASVAVNGVCLSLVRAERNALVFNLSRETLDRSNLGALKPHDRLNLELPLTLAAPLGGHIVSGHTPLSAMLLMPSRICAPASSLTVFSMTRSL